MVPTEAGLYPGVSFGEYRAWPFANQSTLKLMGERSPAHAKQEMDNPSPSTPAQQLGDAVHKCVLQPDLFPAEYIRGPEGHWGRKPAKGELEELRADYPDATILKPTDYDHCLAMRDAVRNHPMAARLLEGNAELSAVWEDKETGVWCKARFDDVARKAGALIDLKTTDDASPWNFPKVIYRFGYYLQAAMYLGGAQALGEDVDLFAIIAVEKEPPYCVAVYQIEDEAIQAGRDELRPLLEEYAECQRTGVWPGYGDGATRITLPPWSWRQIEDRLEERVG